MYNGHPLVTTPPALAGGVVTIRQGDMYFVPARRWNLRELERSNHTPVQLENGSVQVTHPTHPSVLLDGPHRAYQQVLVANGWGRGGGKGHAD